MMANKLKNWIIIALLILLIVAGFFGGKAISKYQKNINALQTANYGLNQQIKLRDIDIKYQEGLVKERDVKVDSLMKVFKEKDKQIAGLSNQLDTALAHLSGITSDSSYKFLQTIAYPFEGDKKYLFNAPQVHGIHQDYLVARSSEITIPILSAEVSNAKLQFSVRDSIELGLKKVIDLQKANLTDCQKINQNDQTIITDTQKALTKETRRKNFWRATTGIGIGTTILALLGIL